MTDSAWYVKIVERSEEDQAFIGYCPGIIGRCCHGNDEVDVYRRTCQIVEDWLTIFRRDGTPFPPPTAGNFELLQDSKRPQTASV